MVATLQKVYKIKLTNKEALVDVGVADQGGVVALVALCICLVISECRLYGNFVTVSLRALDKLEPLRGALWSLSCRMCRPLFIALPSFLVLSLDKSVLLVLLSHLSHGFARYQIIQLLGLRYEGAGHLGMVPYRREHPCDIHQRVVQLGVIEVDVFRLVGDLERLLERVKRMAAQLAHSRVTRIVRIGQYEDVDVAQQADEGCVLVKVHVHGDDGKLNG
mmetsp:Transcript_42243/g.112763  ORF Transcript_42243/g.112763 Transcript_42243/m.112763 type:complete len:219 (+) Transcript_42243:5594-6250(+)